MLQAFATISQGLLTFRNGWRRVRATSLQQEMNAI